MQGIVTGVGPDVYSGGLRITVAKDKWPLSANEKGRIDDAVKVINGSRLPLTYEQGQAYRPVIADCFVPASNRGRKAYDAGRVQRYSFSGRPGAP